MAGMFAKLEEKILNSLTKEPEVIRQPVDQEDWDPREGLAILTEVFPDFLDHISGKTIIDFGCGGGGQSAALAMSGAKRVVGVDINDKSLLKARELIRGLDLEKSVEFRNNIGSDEVGQFDIVISQNSMEHFFDPAGILATMKSALTPEGELFVTFGPPWFAPHGSHMNYFLTIPWANIIFSQRAVMNVRGNFRDDGATRYEDVESGLNKMSARKFEHIIKECGMETRYRKYDCVKDMDFLGHLPLFRELFINRINCILVRKRNEK